MAFTSPTFHSKPNILDANIVCHGVYYTVRSYIMELPLLIILGGSKQGLELVLSLHPAVDHRPSPASTLRIPVYSGVHI